MKKGTNASMCRRRRLTPAAQTLCRHTQPYAAWPPQPPAAAQRVSKTRDCKKKKTKNVYVYTIYIYMQVGSVLQRAPQCLPLTCSSCSSKSPSPVAAQAAALRSAWGEPSASTQYVLHATYAARATRYNATLSRYNSDVCRHAGDRHLVGGARCQLQRAQPRCCSADGK